MESAMKSLMSDHNRYKESFCMYIDRSTEHQCIQQFIVTKLPDIISSIPNGKTTIDVLSLGSGTGEMDLHILSKLQDTFPGHPINNYVVEPSQEHILMYKENASKALNIDNVTFTWHQKTTSEIEQEIKEKNTFKKYDFIHMIQMLYYVKDVPATIEFFHSCLAPDGKLLIIVLSRNSGWNTLYRNHGSRVPANEMCLGLCSEDVTNILDSMSVKYETYDLPTDLDITECFTEGNMNGELLLDMVTETCCFSKTAPPDLKELIMEDLKSPEFSVKKDGKIFFNTDLKVLVIENKQPY
ncbi:histamine N-methyltransferase A-like isoform X1 [Ascaphus truei]|uniref:histamine N-methyltransferase A-like isoform X1 n=1 Tax=Ascaphus truei TaxID=8439 RepID=UPI003F5903AC